MLHGMTLSDLLFPYSTEKYQAGITMTKKVQCGNIFIGGGEPVSVQSMTNKDTRDIKACISQIERLSDAGCDIVRLAVFDKMAAEAFGEIKKATDIPLVADIHFDHRLALAAIEKGADKIRINPGNIGSREKVRRIVDAAKKRGIPIRVGVNSGSLEKDILEKYKGVTAEGLAESAIRSAKMLEDLGFEDLVLSVKASDPAINYDACILLSKMTKHPMHIGVTEAGTKGQGIIKSAVGIGALLLAGVGDTVRVSLTGDPEAEVIAAKNIIAAAGLGRLPINIISCPTCGRSRMDIEKLVIELEKEIVPLCEKRKKAGKKSLDIAVMGCEVNGPGEAKEADFGVACGKGKGLIFIRGKAIKTVPEEEIIKELVRMAENYENI